jgi:threonine dehydratase
LRPGDLTFAHVRELVDDVVTVDDEAIASAVRWLFTEAKLVAEPSGAAAVAAALRAGEEANVVAVVSGGNVDAQDFAKYVAK